MAIGLISPNLLVSRACTFHCKMHWHWCLLHFKSLPRIMLFGFDFQCPTGWSTSLNWPASMGEKKSSLCSKESIWLHEPRLFQAVMKFYQMNRTSMQVLIVGERETVLKFFQLCSTSCQTLYLLNFLFRGILPPKVSPSLTLNSGIPLPCQKFKIS